MITERLELIPATVDLCKAEARGREALGRALGVRVPDSWPPPVFEPDDVERVRRHLERDPDAKFWTLHYVVLRRAPVADGPRALLGVAGFAGPPSTDGAVEIGYAIAEEHQRQGYAMEAVTALLAQAFDAPEVVMVRAGTYAGLEPSIGLLRKAGFSQVGKDPGTGLLRYERRRALRSLAADPPVVERQSRCLRRGAHVEEPAGAAESRKSMTWVKFFAAPEDFPPLLERLLAGERRLFEVYSEPGHPAREFATAGATGSLSLGHDPDGSGVALHLALWVPSVMPRPTLRRIELRGPKFPPGSWRETVEGCGLFWLQTGGLHASAVTASSIGWFTQRAAARQCMVEPGPDSVDWKAHSALAQSLRRLVQRELAGASAGSHPVLPAALQRHREGSRLIAGLGTRQEFRVEAV